MSMEVPSAELIEKLARMKELQIGGAEEDEEEEEFDFEGFEQRQKEIRVELNMRRRQLKQTRDDLDAARVKSHELQYAIDSAKQSAQEYERNMKIAMENNRVLEQTLQESIDSKSKAIREYEVLKSENKMLKETLIQCELEKYNLMRTVDDLQSRGVCNELYRTEIGNQQSKIAALINQTRERFKVMESQHKDLLKQFKEIESYKNILSSTKIMEDKISRLIEEKVLLESELIKSKAKLAQLEQTLTSNPDLISSEETFFFKEWKKCFCKFQQYANAQDEIKCNLLEQLNAEKEANTKLILMMNATKPEEDKFIEEFVNKENDHSEIDNAIDES